MDLLLPVFILVLGTYSCRKFLWCACLMIPEFYFQNSSKVSGSIVCHLDLPLECCYYGVSFYHQKTWFVTSSTVLCDVSLHFIGNRACNIMRQSIIFPVFGGCASQIVGYFRIWWPLVGNMLHICISCIM